MLALASESRKNYDHILLPQIRDVLAKWLHYSGFCVVFAKSLPGNGRLVPAPLLWHLGVILTYILKQYFKSIIFLRNQVMTSMIISRRVETCIAQNKINCKQKIILKYAYLDQFRLMVITIVYIFNSNLNLEERR
jgi:hypothetical protein